MKLFFKKCIVYALMTTLGLSTWFGSGILNIQSAKAAVSYATTLAANPISTTGATLNGVNGDFTAQNNGEAFWYGQTSVASFTATTSPSLPSGWSNPYASTKDYNPGGNFSVAVTGLTENTQYYFVAWTNVGATWYPGEVLSFVTEPKGQVYIDKPADGKMTPGEETFATIQAAIDAANPGDTIGVGAGTYNENITIAESISLIGEDKSTSIVDASGSGVIVTVQSDNVTIKNLTFRNSGTDIAANGGIMILGVDGCTIENNIISNNANGIGLLSSDNNTVKDNSITSSLRYGIVSDASPYTATIPSLSNTISGNIITFSGRDGIYVGQDSNTNTIISNTISGTTGTTEGSNFEGNGIYFWKSSENTVTSNSILNNIRYGIELMGSSNNTFTTNKINGNDTGVIVRHSASYLSLPNTFSGNDFSGNITAGLSSNLSITEGSVDAIKNWWGNDDGPYWNSQVVGLINYSPFCLDSTCVTSGAGVKPVADAGSDQVKNATFTQNGSATDSGSDVASVTWEQVPGSGIVTFGSFDSSTTTISANADGDYVVSFTAVDKAGNSNVDTMSFVWNTKAPDITVPSNIVGFEATSPDGAVVSYTTPTASDDLDGVVAATCDHDSGDTFVIGTTTITCSSIDSAMNLATKSFTVNVVDNTPATVTVTAGSDTIEIHNVFTDAGATWSDIVDGSGTIASATSGSVDVHTVGDYTLTYTYTDANGNSASATRTVHVVDTTAPVISSVWINPNPATTGDEVIFNASASDNRGLASVKISINGGSYNLMENTGDYQFAYAVALNSLNLINYTVKATDVTGLITTESGTINPSDNDAPTITSITGDSAGTTGESVLISVTANDNIAPNRAEITFGGNTTLMTKNGSTFTYSIPVPAGSLASIVYSVNVYDANSNKVVSPDYTITASDNDAPTAGTISISAGVTYTTTKDVTLGLSAQDNIAVAQMSFRNGISGEWSAWETYATTKNWTLTSANGAQTVQARFQDAAGNISEAVEDSIILDTVLPEFSNITATTSNSNSAYAKIGDTVTLNFTTSEAVQSFGATIAGHIVTVTNVDGNDHTATYTMVEGDTEGLVVYTIDAKDLAGNNAIQLSANSTITFDKTAPTLTVTGENPITIVYGSKYDDLGGTTTELGATVITTGVDAIDTGLVGTEQLVTYSVKDLAGNEKVDYRKVIVKATETQFQLGEDNEMTDPLVNEIIVSVGGTESAIVNFEANVPNPVMNLSGLLETGLTTKSVTLTQSITASVTTAGVKITAEFPKGITITGGSAWDGTIKLPAIISSDNITKMIAAGLISENIAEIEIGFPDVTLTFDKDHPVKITMPGQAGKTVGYIKNNVLYSISDTCSSIDNPTLGAGKECKINSADGKDMIIWTMHFTKFVTYTETAVVAPVYSTTISNQTLSVDWKGNKSSQYKVIITGSTNYNDTINADSANDTNFAYTKNYVLNPGSYTVIVKAIKDGKESVNTATQTIEIGAPVVAATVDATTPVTYYPAPATVKAAAPAVTATPVPSDEDGKVKAVEEEAATDEDTTNWTPWIVLFILLMLAGAATAGYFRWFNQPEVVVKGKKSGKRVVATKAKVAKKIVKSDKKIKRW